MRLYLARLSLVCLFLVGNRVSRVARRRGGHQGRMRLIFTCVHVTSGLLENVAITIPKKFSENYMRDSPAADVT